MPKMNDEKRVKFDENLYRIQYINDVKLYVNDDKFDYEKQK